MNGALNVALVMSGGGMSNLPGVSVDGSSVGFVGMSEDVVDASHDVPGMTGESCVHSHHVSVLMFGESGLLHDAEHFVDSTLMVDGGSMDDSVELVYQLHVSDGVVLLGHVE